MKVVKIVEDAMEYNELGTLVILNDKIDMANVQADIDALIGWFEDEGEEWYLSDIIDGLNEIGYECQFFDDRFIGEVIC